MILILCALAPLLHAADVTKPATAPATAPASTFPGAGWPFHVTAIASEKSASYDVMLEHSGLAQADGRDIRIASPAGQPVSHFIAYSDPFKARIVFDGSAGPGEYSIYFGNLSPLLPLETDVARFGRKEWTPPGGFSVTNYAQTLQLLKGQILGKKAARANFEKAQAAALAVQRLANLCMSPTQYVYTRFLRGSDSEMGTNTYHVFRAEIDLPKTGEYEIQFGAGAASELGMLYLDGAADPLIDGSFKTPDAFMVIATQAKLNLPAGPHVFEMWTIRRVADLRMRAPGGAQLRFLNGLDAHFNQTARLTAGAIESGPTPLADAYVATIREWVAQERFGHARAVAQVARQRFVGDADHDKLFAAEYERAGQTAYDRNWLTEGKYASRAGVVPQAAFYPPLRMSGTITDSSNWDVRHQSSAISVEGRIVYGLPFQIMLSRPWGITSAVCVDDDVLYVGAKNGVMHAIYLSSGEEKWAFAGGGECLGPPLVYRGAVYYGGIDRRLYAVDAQRGRMMWNFPVGGWMEGGAAAADGRLFFGSRDGNLYAVDAALGVERWHLPLGGSILATPCVAAGRVFVGTRAGEFFAVDAESGRVLWKYAAGAEIQGGACATETHVAFGDLAGRVHFLNAATGKLAWNKPAAVDGPVIAAPILVGDILFGGTDDGKLFGIDAANGAVGWEAPMPYGGSIARPPVFAADTLVFTSHGRNPIGPDGKTVVNNTGCTASFVLGPSRTDLKWRPVASAVNKDAEPLDKALESAERLPGLLKRNGLSEGDGPADVRLAWDEKHLYLSATIKASDLVAPADPQDLRGGSSIALLLDPDRDGSVVYEFTAAANGKTSLATHFGIGAESVNPKTMSPADRFAIALRTFPGTGAALQNVIAQEKQLLWSPQWTADVHADGNVRTPDQAAHPGNVLWHVKMTIPLDDIPKGVSRVGPRGTWRINLLLTDSTGAGSGKPILKTWALCPPAAGEPLGPVARWPSAEFMPVQK